MRQFLLVLCGIPASGKSTLAIAIRERTSQTQNVVIVSTDDWRDEEYYSDFTPEKEQIVRKRALHKTRQMINKGLSVIHDDTNYYQSMRHDLYEIAVDRGCVFGVVYVSTPPDIAMRWNRLRNIHIPDEVIERIHDRFDLPGKKYLWDRPIMTINLFVMPVDSVAMDLAERLRALRPVRKPTPHEMNHNTERVLLDVITRQVVRKFLQEMPEYQKDPRVSKIRREVLREAREKGFSPHETEQTLRVRLGILSARVS